MIRPPRPLLAGVLAPVRCLALALALALAAPPAALAEALRVATAANFRPAMEALAEAWAAETGQAVTPVYGSTGKHYAQLRQGAPYDAWFAADAERPARLEADGATVAGTRFTYAVGVLVLFSPRAGLVDPDGRVLAGDGFERLAVANPRLAPYGRAAVQAMEGLGVFERLERRIVLGENVGQAMAFVLSGNAELGFVAFSQLHRPEGGLREGSWWRVPATLHDPIEQQAVLLRESPAGRAFLAWVRGDKGRALIRRWGYGTP